MFRELFTTGACVRLGARRGGGAAASFASAIRISEGEEETASSGSSSLLLPSLFPLRLDNRNGKVKTNFGGEEGMQECGK